MRQWKGGKERNWGWIFGEEKEDAIKKYCGEDSLRVVESQWEELNARRGEWGE